MPGKPAAIALLAPDQLEKLADGIATGLTKTQMGALLGLSAAHVAELLERGKKDDEAGLATPEAWIVREAQKRLARAQSEALSTIREAIRPHRKVITETTVYRGHPSTKTREEAVPGDWQAAAWLLERTNPMQWGKRQVLAHVAADGSETYKRIMLEGDAPTDARPTLDLDPTKVVAGGATSAFNGLTHLSLASGDVLDSDPGSDPPGGPVDA